jgi:hypothetical protein
MSDKIKKDKIFEGNSLIAEFMGKKMEDYANSLMTDIHGTPILEGSIINADGYNSELSGTYETDGDNGDPLFHCVEFYKGKFGCNIYSDFEPLDSYKTIEVVGHCKDFKEVYNSGKWQGNLGSAMKRNEGMQYHSSWNLLMPVIFKIQSINPPAAVFEIGAGVVRLKVLLRTTEKHFEKIIYRKAYSDEAGMLQATRGACVWYLEDIADTMAESKRSTGYAG